jgi:ParB family chromosome partitioning protein
VSKRRLGKGIDALLQGRPLEELSNMATVIQVDLDQLQPNPHQPRTTFEEGALSELADSIREKGILQPILAEDRGDGTFTIVAGERRFRAARMAGLAQVPVISQEFSDEEKIEIALVENLQREDLNPVDEARALDNAMKSGGYTQEKLARRLGRSRAAVANSLRLLKLEPAILDALADGTITAGHARALLSVADDAERKQLFGQIVTGELSVRETEFRASGERGEKDDAGEDPTPAGKAPAGKTARRAPAPLDPELKRLQDKLVDRLGTNVVIQPEAKGGNIRITYYHADDLERLLEILDITLD